MASSKEDYYKLADRYNKLDNDVQRWQWILDHRLSGITLWLYSDNTCVTFDNQAKLILSFDCPLGTQTGVTKLLDTLGINYICV